MSKPKPWEFQPDFDTGTEYSRFHEFYLPQNNPRTLDEAYRRYWHQKWHKKVTKRAPGGWRAWQEKYNWKERAQAWDRHNETLDNEFWAKAYQKTRKDGYEAAQDFRKLVGKAKQYINDKQLYRPKRTVKRGIPDRIYVDKDGKETFRKGEPEKEVTTIGVDWNTIIKILEYSDKIERLAEEKATDITETRDMDSLSDEELQRIIDNERNRSRE